MSDLIRLCHSAARAIPGKPPPIIEWAEKNVKLPGSPRSDRFDVSVTPWLREPLEMLFNGLTRIVDLIKPVQSGGSVAGEVALLYIMRFLAGICFYNWPDDKKAAGRWTSRFEDIIQACAEVQALVDALPRFDAVDSQIDFGRLLFRMQGVFQSGNLDSDTVRFQVNEELHQWEPGHLAKSENRTTAVWNYLIFNVSNAGKVGDQLHQSFEAGTMQYWEVKCPGCSNPHHEANSVFHQMRAQWDDVKPHLGGLRYDSEGCRLSNGGFNYNKLEPTIRYQMPCGFIVRDSEVERRALSLGGRYCAPTNDGAHLSHRSYTYEAVSVDYISWLKLIQDKHKALFARRHGDPEPWIKYKTERECKFYDPNDAPIVGKIVLNTAQNKNRDGLKDRVLRLFALDRQQGESAKNEFPHWWLLIRDIASNGDSLLVYEGKVETDEQVIAILDDHKCNRWHGVADSGDDTMHVYLFCLKYGINAIKGGTEQFYTHEAGPRRIFSLEKPLHGMINRDPLFPYAESDEGLIPDQREPLFWLYSKVGIRECLHWLRASTKHEVPGDASEDYRSHNEAEERVTRQHPRTGETIHEYHQLKSRNDLYVCECYVAMQMLMAGNIGVMPEEPKGESKE